MRFVSLCNYIGLVFLGMFKRAISQGAAKMTIICQISRFSFKYAYPLNQISYLSKKFDIMAILKLKSEKVKAIVLFSTGAFVAAAAMYFSETGPACRIAFPLTILTIASMWLTPWQITLAMLFSALGDLFGSEGSFIMQMGAFAIAHIWLICFFIQRYLTKVSGDKRLTAKMKGYVMLVAIWTLALLGFVFTKIVPEAPAGIIRAGTGIYACIICCMLVCALIQRSTLYALGAILFVFSDFILAWNMFTEAVPHAGYLIMIPYYIGQWLLFVRATPYRIEGLRRHRM